MKVKIEKAPIISSIIFFLAGLLLFINFNGVINFISYALGTIIIALGVFKLWCYYRSKLNNTADYNEFGFGLVDVILGILIIVLSEAFTTILRFAVGGWILLAGINRFIQAVTMPEKKARFTSLLIMSIVVIAGGVYVILVKDALNLIGLIMMIYAIIELVENMLYVDKTIDIIPTEEEIIEVDVKEVKPKNKSNKKKSKKE